MITHEPEPLREEEAAAGVRSSTEDDGMTSPLKLLSHPTKMA